MYAAGAPLSPYTIEIAILQLQQLSLSTLLAKGFSQAPLSPPSQGRSRGPGTLVTFPVTDCLLPRRARSKPVPRLGGDDDATHSHSTSGSALSTCHVPAKINLCCGLRGWVSRGRRRPWKDSENSPGIRKLLRGRARIHPGRGAPKTSLGSVPTSHDQ